MRKSLLLSKLKHMWNSLLLGLQIPTKLLITWKHVFSYLLQYNNIIFSRNIKMQEKYLGTF